jgi:ribosomal protein S18 acetylase RimI-like enzyme
MTTPLVRAATEDDIAGLILFYQEFHAFHVAGVPERLRVPEQYDIPRIQATLTDYIHRPDVALLVAEQDTDLLGFVEVYVQEDPEDAAVVPHRYGYVQSLMVTAQHRKAGIGRALLRAAKEWATAQGITQLRLSLWEFDAGPLHFYERLGFRTMKREMVIDTTIVEWE